MEQNPKQQVVERIKGSTNILVTVSANPSVDQLAACIGFTLLLNKYGKHATAVFSGDVPSTIEFLQPHKTLEPNTDSLQDFIIALDKSKADKLRYKVEDNVVRIFITPYRASLSEKDLEFSLGDFNVDVVVALGVTKKEDLDKAVVTHGRILHDAVVLGITNGELSSGLGSVNWHDQAASSLSEMLVSISESFQSGLLDGQIATAFLTGIVAETERFSNQKTSPKVMTMSAQLMAAGANQLLVASELSAKQEIPELSVDEPADDAAAEPANQPEQPADQAPNLVDQDSANTTPADALQGTDEPDLPAEQPTQAPTEPADQSAVAPEPAADESPKPQTRLPRPIIQSPAEPPKPRIHGQLLIPHDSTDILLPGEKAPEPEPDPDEIHIDDLGNLKSQAELEEDRKNQEKQDNDDSSKADTQKSQDATSDVTPDLSSDESSKKIIEPMSLVDPAAMHNPSDDAGPSAAIPPVSLPPVDPAAMADSVGLGDTLAQLEQNVGSPHALLGSDGTSLPDVDNARSAVQTASIDSAYRPEPVQSLGAQFVDISSPKPTVVNPGGVVMPGSVPAAMQQPAATPDAPSTGSATDQPVQSVEKIDVDPLAQRSTVIVPTQVPNHDPMAPPPVPPPMTPPFFSPQTSHHNPYLNPSDTAGGQKSDDQLV